MQDDLIERLRAKEQRFWVDGQQPAYLDSIFGEAAARIEALEADNKRLMRLVKEARKQVAHMAEEYQRDSTWDLLERIDATLARIKEQADG